MEIGSKFIFVPKKREVEEIYEDELVDGLANAAKEQAQVWAEQAQIESASTPASNAPAAPSPAAAAAAAGGGGAGSGKPANPGFFAELLRMGKSALRGSSSSSSASSSSSSSSFSSSAASHSDQVASHNGVFCSARRLQPRFQKGKAKEFDSMVNARIQAERAAMDKRKIQLMEKARSSSIADSKHDNNNNNNAHLSSSSLIESTGESPKLTLSPHINTVFPCNSNSNSNDDSDKQEQPVTLIIDHGRCMKVGFSGDDGPRDVFPALVGRPRHKGVMVGMSQKDAYVGDEAQSKRGILTHKYPLEGGVVTNFDDAEKLWHHSFYNCLRAAPEEHPVLLTFRPNQPDSLIQKYTQTMFESFNVPALAILPQPLLSILLTGSTTGLVVDIGEDSTHICCVNSGRIVNNSVTQVEISGKHITDYLMSILTEKGYAFTTTAERDVVRDIKEKLTYVCMDPSAELKKPPSTLEKQYELPDGQVISITNERFRAFEPLFTPSLMNKDTMGLIEAIHYSVSRSASTTSQQGTYYSNIVVCGGTSLAPGFLERVESDLKLSIPVVFDSNIVRVSKMAERKYASWVGASIFAGVPDFKLNVITKMDYDEQGPKVIRDKWQGCYTHGASLPPPFPKSLGSSVDATSSTSSSSSSSSSSSASSSVEAPSGGIISQDMSDTNVIHLSLGELVGKSIEPTTGDPEPCSSCSAVINKHSKITFNKDEGSALWICEFCRHPNQLMGFDDAQIPKDEEAHYILEPAPPSTKKQSPLVIFCLDCSGSMCVTTEVNGHIDFGRAAAHNPDLSSFNDGSDQRLPSQRGYGMSYVSRLQCVQLKVARQIAELRESNPHVQPVLITFNREVSVFGTNGPHHVEVLTGDILHDYDKLIAKGREIGESKFSRGIQPLSNDEYKTFLDHLYAMQEGGATALGPALACAIGMTASTRGSRILVCTDGLANVGIGDLTAVGPDAIARHAAFYTQLGNLARDQATVVDVLSIRGDDCRMEALGAVADATNGEVDIVDPIDLVNLRQAGGAASEIKTVLASAVSVTLTLPKGLVFRDNDNRLPSAPGGVSMPTSSSSSSVVVEQEGERSNNVKNESSSFSKEIGNVTEETELSVSFTPASETPVFEPGAQLTLQARILHTLPNGARCMRVISRECPVTDDRSVAEKEMNAEVIGLHGVKASAVLAQAGDYQQARLHLISHQRLLQRGMRDVTQQRAYINYIVEGERLDGFMRENNYQEAVLGSPALNLEPPQQQQQQQVKPSPYAAAPSSFSASAAYAGAAAPTPALISNSVRQSARDDSASKNVLQMKHMCKAKWNRK